MSTDKPDPLEEAAALIEPHLENPRDGSARAIARAAITAYLDAVGVEKALRPFAKIEMPYGADDGTWVARTLHCNDQVTAHSVRQAQAALNAITALKRPLEKP